MTARRQSVICCKRVDILRWVTAAIAKAAMVMRQHHEPRRGKGFGHRFEAVIFGARATCSVKYL